MSGLPAGCVIAWNWLNFAATVVMRGIWLSSQAKRVIISGSQNAIQEGREAVASYSPILDSLASTTSSTFLWATIAGTSPTGSSPLFLLPRRKERTISLALPYNVVMGNGTLS